MNASVIFGMPRSGTSFLLDWIGERFPVLRINEPHFVWKKQRFVIEDDGPFDSNDADAVKEKFKRIAEARPILEKSPANIVRAEFVLNVFSDTKYIIVDRDDVKIIESCLKRSGRKVQMSGLILRKYLGRGTDTQSGASSPLALRRQVDASDAPKLLRLFREAAALGRLGLLPFGPRISGFAETYAKAPRSYYENLIETSHQQKALVEKHARDCFRLNIDDFSRYEKRLEDFCRRALGGRDQRQPVPNKSARSLTT